MDFFRDFFFLNQISELLIRLVLEAARSSAAFAISVLLGKCFLPNLKLKLALRSKIIIWKEERKKRIKEENDERDCKEEKHIRLAMKSRWSIEITNNIQNNMSFQFETKIRTQNDWNSKSNSQTTTTKKKNLDPYHQIDARIPTKSNNDYAMQRKLRNII